VLLEGATAEERKAHPLFSGCLNYFPDALLAVAAVSRRGSEQHNPGEPMHWDMSKSQDEADSMARHMVAGEWDKAAWRGLANLQRAILAGWRPKDAGREGERLLAELRDCEEVFVSGGHVDQMGAEEPRFKVTITGPTRLLVPLMDALA
jgi:hypothetical protein